MALVGSFSSRPHADMAASMLQARGIRAQILGDDAGVAGPLSPTRILGALVVLVIVASLLVEALG